MYGSFGKDNAVIKAYDTCKKLYKALENNDKFKELEFYKFEDAIAGLNPLKLENLKNLSERLISALEQNNVSKHVRSNRNEDDKYSLVWLEKDLTKLFKVAKSLELVKKCKRNETISLAGCSNSQKVVKNFLSDFIKGSSEKTKALKKIQKASSLEEQLDILKRFLLRQKRKKKSIIKRAAHKVKKVLLGDKSEAGKVKKCFTEVGKCIKKSKLDKLEEKMKISGWDNWNGITGNLLKEYGDDYDKKYQVVFMSFIGLKNAKNVIAACDGLKEGGAKSIGDQYEKIRKAIKAECLDEKLTKENLEKCIIESFRRYPANSANLCGVKEVFNYIARKYKDCTWDGGSTSDQQSNP